VIIMIRIIPPDEAKKKARANLAAWKREKAFNSTKGRTEPGGPATLSSPNKALSYEERAKLDLQLIESAKQGDTERVVDLLDNGAHIDAVDLRHGANALYWAVHGSHIETAEVLLDKGADVNMAPKSCFTALIIAARYGDDRMVEILLEKGADVDRKDVGGMTALRQASLCGRESIVELLKRYGAK